MRYGSAVYRNGEFYCVEFFLFSSLFLFLLIDGLVTKMQFHLLIIIYNITLFCVSFITYQKIQTHAQNVENINKLKKKNYDDNYQINEEFFVVADEMKLKSLSIVSLFFASPFFM